MSPAGMLVFPPDNGIPSTAVTTHGGAILTGVPVQVLYWGSDWLRRIDPNTGRALSDSFTTVVQAILNGPWMSGLRQYGIRRCSFGSATTVGTDPPLLPHTFDNGDVEGLIQSRIDAGQLALRSVWG